MHLLNVLSAVLAILLVFTVVREVMTAGKTDFVLRLNRVMALVIAPFAVLFVVLLSLLVASFLFNTPTF
jgi:hypothetical protein